MAFKREYEQVEFDFDQEWAAWNVQDPVLQEQVDAPKVFNLAVRDGSNAAYVDFNRDEAEELLNLLQAEINKHDAWYAEQATNTQEDN